MSERGLGAGMRGGGYRGSPPQVLVVLSPLRQLPETWFMSRPWMVLGGWAGVMALLALACNRSPSPKEKPVREEPSAATELNRPVVGERGGTGRGDLSGGERDMTPGQGAATGSP